ncbi:MAG: phytanoyl-CoA dioxygenase family protein [Proteobacteria bacterium]|nr:phytanoyl-CoA dioxygenase family protein [Pseudomonadota bacterium]
MSLTESEIAAFGRDGYVLRRGLFAPDEVALLSDAIVNDPAIAKNTYVRPDSKGASTELALWNHPSDDVFGAVARSARIVDSMEKLLGGEVYHYHSKLTMKRPKVGGAWDWHQDYGYWYRNGCLFPLMASVFISVDPSTRENGCLEVLKGSHLLGRLEHGVVGGQVGADMERVEQAMKVLEHVYVEQAPGDALFFHCNTLHTSGQNVSEKSRNVLLCCYNAARNSPYREGQHPGYTKLDKLPDGAVLAARPRTLEGQEFYRPAPRTPEPARG